MGDLALMLAMWMSFSPTANALRALPGTYRVSVASGITWTPAWR